MLAVIECRQYLLVHKNNLRILRIGCIPILRIFPWVRFRFHVKKAVLASFGFALLGWSSLLVSPNIFLQPHEACDFNNRHPCKIWDNLIFRQTENFTLFFKVKSQIRKIFLKKKCKKCKLFLKKFTRCCKMHFRSQFHGTRMSVKKIDTKNTPQRFLA